MCSKKVVFGDVKRRMDASQAQMTSITGIRLMHRARLMRHVRSDRGQMVVELAVVAPVMIAVALLVVNLMQFVGTSAAFDRLAPDAIMALAVAPEGTGDASSDVTHGVGQAIHEALGGSERLDVHVDTQNAWQAAQVKGDGALLSFAPHLTRYVCTLRFSPWPSSIAIAGVDLHVPLYLEHTRSFTVDRYRPGVFF